MNKDEMLKRCAVLLQAAIDVTRNGANEDATAAWDETECDGACLIDEAAVMIEDIKAEVGE
jgi:NADH:ubiquinone oxidoreductase subunit E